MASSAGGMASLHDQLVKLIKKQKQLSDEFNAFLTHPTDGLRENTRKTIKNLDVAVVQSRQPGYFHYHERSDRVRKVEEGDLLNKKLAEIKRVEKQIKQVQAQMAKAEKPPAAADGKQMHTFKQWFAEYKRPDPVMLESFKSTFQSSPKVYGGSTHYDSFRSIAATMKRGKLTK